MTTGCVILAAGAGRRLGGVAKALVPLGDATLLARVLATARAAGPVDPWVVVGPPFGEEVAAHARALGARIVENSDPSRGMASSVALGFAALAAHAAADIDAAWLWPVDHARVTAATLRRLRAAFVADGIVVPRHAGRGGHPPLIARAHWAALAGCGALDGGARAVIAPHARGVEVDDPGVVRDLDTPADLAEAR